MYLAGTQVTLTATPNVVGSVFSSWTGTTNSSTNPLTVMMTSNVNETANFQQSGNAINVDSQISYTLKATGFNKNTGVSTFNYTITNKSNQTIAGPVQVVMLNPSDPAKAVNKTGVVSPGYAYWTINSPVPPKTTLGLIIEVITPQTTMPTLSVYSGHF